MIKNIKSFSVVDVKPVGADAVTAVKLAVEFAVILEAFFTNDFLIYSSNDDTLVPTADPFKVSEPLTLTEPVN